MISDLKNQGLAIDKEVELQQTFSHENGPQQQLESGFQKFSNDKKALIQTETKMEKPVNLKYILIVLGVIVSIGIIAFLVVYFTVIKKNKNAEFYDFFQLSSAQGLCLDGSNAGYHVSRTGDPSKILIFFQSGGWCAEATDQKTLEYCYQRSLEALGNSQKQAQQPSIKVGLMSKDPKNYFKDWKKVFFHYCDGTGHQGSKREPILYKNRLLYFRGHNITVQRFEDLEKNLGLFTKAEKVVISGGSAGGLAATMWANYLAEKVKKGKVYCVVDAAVFYDSQNLLTKTNLFKDKFVNLMKISNAEIDPPVPECLQKFPDSRVNCMFAQNLLEHVKVPLFVTQSLYDWYQLIHNLGSTCVTDSISNCKDNELAAVEENRVNVTAVLQKVAKKPQNGIWGLSCKIHQILMTAEFSNEDFSVNQYSEYTANRAIGEWLQDQGKNNIHLDLLPWPNNKPCA